MSDGPHAAWKPTREELARIVARHRGWLSQPHPEEPNFLPVALPEHDAYLDRAVGPDWRTEALEHPEKADLRNAILSDDTTFGLVPSADLRGVTLLRANLSNAVLRVAHLENADLNSADLSGADLTNACLAGADLRGASFVGAKLVRADVTGADFRCADLREADVRYAILRNAQLCGDAGGELDVGRAKLAYADLTGATYAPASEPPDPYLAGIRGLARVRIPPGKHAGMVQLRKLLQDAGLRPQERDATYAVECSKATGFWGLVRTVAFNATTAYGRAPGRALLLLLAFLVLFLPVYALAIVAPPGTPPRANGIYQVFPKDRVDVTARPPAPAANERVVPVLDPDWRGAIGRAAYFSLLSAVNIGFQQFTPGDWVRRLQSDEYTVQGVGWMRVVAGAQALLSVYLLAMWVLTYFGRPFQ